jgi:hypothetical protein
MFCFFLSVFSRMELCHDDELYDDGWDDEEEDNVGYSGRYNRYENEVVSPPRGKRPKTDILPVPNSDENLEDLAIRRKACGEAEIAAIDLKLTADRSAEDPYGGYIDKTGARYSGSISAERATEFFLLVHERDPA